MDDTTQTRISDAAATRKRRSSILKSQRPARTPFSELEFHVATPTDTSKSRRVSFSRRTGVAEFATNEATTTWKNFYEEHNKSLESSGTSNSSGNNSKQNLDHIGKSRFDQQFEEVDALDFMGSLNPGYNVTSSISTVNFLKLTSIECTDDIKLTAPQNNFELSAFTNDHSKLFNNDITVPGTGEQSERIDINFSALQKIEDKDDLDEIQRDFQNQGNIICHGPLRDKQNLSEYIEIDLNSTNAVLRNDESDMSITDTIHSPKVQEVSKSVSIEKIVNKDWETDKENIAVNPYVTPKESVNFAINYEQDKVLVFDGKRLTIQCEKVPSESISRDTIIPNEIEPPKATHRKTIVLNVNDDLPNFIDDSTNATGYLSVADLKKHIELDSSVSITNPIVNINRTQEQKSVLYDDDIGDISLTQAVSSKIVEQKRRTIVFEDGTSNISITQAVPTNIIDKNEKRRTILYENDTGNISITQALPTNLISNERRNTVFYENNDCNISMTQALPANIITEKVQNEIKTTVYEDDTRNLSKTKALPYMVISVKSPTKSRTSEDGLGNMSVTQAISSNIIIEENLQERRRTVVFESDTSNISVTQAVPSNLIYTHKHDPINILSDDEINRRKTVVFEDSAGNLSVTESVSFNIIPNPKPQENKRKTIIFNEEEADISMTQAVPMNKLISFTNDEKNKVINNTSKRNTIVFDNTEADISVTQAIDQIINGFENTISKDMPKTEKRQTIVFADENGDISTTQVVDVNRIKDTTLHTDEVNDIACDEYADVSRSKVLPTQEQGKCIVFKDDVFLVDEKPTHHVTLQKSNINEILDISMGEDKKNSHDSKMFKEFNKTINVTVAKENDIDIPMEDGSLSKPIPHNLSQIQDVVLDKSLKQYNKAAKNELDDLNVNVSKVLVYQISQSGQIVEKETEKASTDAKVDDVIPKQIDNKKKVTLPVEEPDIYSESPSEEEIIKINSEQTLKADKESVLHSLLDMSTSPLVKRATNRMESNIEQMYSAVSINKEAITGDTSNDSLFYITKDVDEEVSKKVPELEQVHHLPLEYKEESPVVNELQKKLALLKTVFGGSIHQQSKDTRRNSKKHEDTKSNIKEKGKYSKCFKNANDTNELLDMLSDLTDKQASRIVDSEVSEEEPEPLMIKGHLALENKTETSKGTHLKKTEKGTDPKKIETGTDPKRPSFKPEKRSVALGHEDIMNNISIAGAALQKSRLEFDKFNDSVDSNASTNKAVVLSKEIVKTLQFDEDSISEVSVSNNQASPLKKTAFGERSYMAKNKANVIPSFLKDVTDGLKELMDDLVKPMADNLPFDSVDRIPKKTTSTCSMQIQADLITSSQVDMDFELYSNSNSMDDLPRTSSAEIIKDAVQRSITHSLKSSVKSETVMTHESEFKFKDATKPAQDVTVTPKLATDIIAAANPALDLMAASRPSSGVTAPGVVIVFDHNNPLNNILLPPPEKGDIHKYNPSKAHTICTLEQNYSPPLSSAQNSDVKSTPKDIDKYPEQVNHLKAESSISSVNKPMSIDRSENTQNNFKDTEVNTIIAMKGNKELLEVSSSLTLVDDAMMHISYDPEAKDSPLQLLYKLDDNEQPEKDSDLTSTDEDLIQYQTKAKKRNHSPVRVDKHKNCTFSSIDVTPKPQTKMQKISERSFKEQKSEKPTKLKADKDENKTDIKQMSSPTKRISFTPKQLEPKPAPSLSKRIALKLSSTKQHRKKENITVNQVLTDIRMNIDQPPLEQQTKEVLSTDLSSEVEPKTVSISNSDLESIDMVSSFTSSKNLGRDDQSIVTSSCEHHFSDECSQMEWQDRNEYTRGYVSDCDSSVNIVAKIDMLPFMGSHECEWESSIGDTWSFRLLHSCLRLSVRLQHRHENATRTCVRADTPILHSQIEIMHTEKKNPIAELCIRFAGEAMRFELSHECSRAGSVPALVRRCAATARLATRWARIMHDARARLAYSLTQDGILALKVANIPLRSVWEVRLKIDLVVSEAGSAPFPRATPLAAVRVLAERHVHVKELRHLIKNLPHDWGHVPRTIWRIFKYLKNKRREDEFLELKY